MRRTLREGGEIDVGDVRKFQSDLIGIRATVDEIHDKLSKVPTKFKKDFREISNLRPLEDSMEDFRDEIKKVSDKILSYNRHMRRQ